MKARVFHTLIMAVTIFLLGFTAAKASEELQPPEGDLQKVELASALSEYGKEHDDALALIAAARIYSSIAGTVQGKDGEPLDVDTLLQTAELLAKTEHAQDSIMGLIEDARTATKAWVPMTCWHYEYYCDWSGCRYVTVWYPC